MWANVQQVAAHFLLTAPDHVVQGELMGLLTEEQAEQVWEEQGMGLHVGRMYDYLVHHGLMPMSVQRHTFLDNFRKRILTNFLVKGVVEDEHGRKVFPADGA